MNKNLINWIKVTKKLRSILKKAPITQLLIVIESKNSILFLLIYYTNDRIAGIDISDFCYLAYESRSYR